MRRAWFPSSRNFADAGSRPRALVSEFQDVALMPFLKAGLYEFQGYAKPRNTLGREPHIPKPLTIEPQLHRNPKTTRSPDKDALVVRKKF